MGQLDSACFPDQASSLLSVCANAIHARDDIMINRNHSWIGSVQSLRCFTVPVLRRFSDVRFPGDHWYPIGKITTWRATDSSVSSGSSDSFFFFPWNLGARSRDILTEGGREGVDDRCRMTRTVILKIFISRRRKINGVGAFSMA